MKKLMLLLALTLTMAFSAAADDPGVVPTGGRAACTDCQVVSVKTVEAPAPAKSLLTRFWSFLTSSD